VFIFCAFFAFFKVADALVGNRVSAEDELQGLDMGEMGVLGYPDSTLAPVGSSSSGHVGALEPAITTRTLKPATE
jgi:hypothetical protein